MSINPQIFREYDIRGIVGKDLTPETVQQIGKAIGTYMKRQGGKSLVLGRDVRSSSLEFSDILSKALNSTGCNVVDIGMVPTPVTYFSLHHLKADGGVMITGSHNPPEYNGLKMMIGGVTLAEARIQALLQNLQNNTLSRGSGSTSQQDIVATYTQKMLPVCKLNRPLNVVVDCGNGVAGGIAPDIIEGLGCTVTPLFCEVDGNFPNHHPDPAEPKNLQDLIAKVKEAGADVGLAFDGDGDRLGVVTPQGAIIWPDKLMMFFAEDICPRHPGETIIFDVKCSRYLPEVVRGAGGEPLMWKTGHSFIKAKLKESGAVLAGEMSGHIFFKERWYGFDDGIYAAARLCELLSAQDETPTAVFKSIPELVSTPELRLEMEEGKHHALVEQLVRNAWFPTGEICTIDGIRVDFETGFGLARASNTTPTVILRFEADNQQQLIDIQEQFRAQLLALQPELKLPF